MSSFLNAILHLVCCQGLFIKVGSRDGASFFHALPVLGAVFRTIKHFRHQCPIEDVIRPLVRLEQLSWTHHPFFLFRKLSCRGRLETGEFSERCHHGVHLGWVISNEFSVAVGEIKETGQISVVRG